MRITPIQSTFHTGEISPRLLSRIDLEAYYSGSAELTNFVCLPHGPLLRRAGTRFIAQAGSTDVRLVPFRFSTSNSLIIEFGNYYARFFFAQGQVMSSGSPYQIVTPWSASQVKDLDFAQSGDLLYVVHPLFFPHKLSRSANDNWTLAVVTFTNKPSEWTDNNYPSHICFSEQRLYYAATPNEPQTVWASRVGLFDEFTTTDSAGEILDDYAFSYTISSDEVNGIRWMQDLNILAIGTAGAEYCMMASSLTAAITPSNVRIKKQTAYGSANIVPMPVDSGAVFVQRGATRVRMFEYQYTADQYTAADLTVMSEHILKSGVVDISLQTVPDTYMWMTLSNGTLVGLTYEKQQKVAAWHKHTLGGDGKVKSVAVIPGEASDESDEVWLAVERTINGTTVVYIEAFIDAFSETDAVEDGRFVDSYLEYTGAAVSTLSGLSHLEGKEVSVLVDGWVHPNVTVTNGSITLQDSGSNIVVGLPYESYFESCPIQARDTVTTGLLKRVYEADISLLKSLGFSYGVVGEREQQQFMGPTKVMNKAQSLFTGTINIDVPGGFSTERQVFVKQTLPLPCEIRSIKYDMEVNR